MPLRRPGLRELIDRTDAELAQRLGLGALLRRGVAAAFSRVLSGLAHGWYGAMEWAARQAFVDTAEAEHLDPIADRWGITRKPATASKGTIQFSGAEASTAPAGTVLRRADGVQYLTTADATLGAGGVASVGVESVLPADEANAPAATTLTLVSPVAGFQASAAVETGGLVGGADTEGDEDLRARVLLRIRQPPMGGTEADFVQWALTVSGVTRAWAIGNYFRYGTVGVWFVVDGDPGGLIPSAAKVAEVQAVIDELRPVTAQTTVLAPVSVAVNFTVHVTPDTAGIRALAEAALTDLITREAEPGGALLISRMREAISTVPGETDHVLSAPTADVVLLPGQLAVMGVVTWV